MIYNQDCMEAMKEMSDNQFDLAIVDPPYGIGEDGKKNHSRGGKAKPTLYTPKNWDSKSPDKDFFIQVKRVSKNQIIFGANHFVENIPYPNSSCWIVWDKLNGNNDFADCELAYTSFKTSVRKYNFRWAGMLQGDMKNKEIRIHPTQKPVKLYEWLLIKYAKEGDTILDTHLGSGSIAIACHNLGFELTGYEIDKEYFEAAKKRIEQHKQQGRLW
jgi:site-specific DNA-methyltransferase (adenine-specific)